MKKENPIFVFLIIVLVFTGSIIVSCGSDSEGSEEPGMVDPDPDPEPDPLDCTENFNLELTLPGEEINLSDWDLIWTDDFDYPDAMLENNWTSQNGPSGHILCSRWRENAEVKDGVLELKAIKENRGGQDWTCGSIWSKQTFGYGYFECRYKYAGAAGTNNSFWLFDRVIGINSSEVGCELDINEGHFPNEVNTNRHHWTNGSSEFNSFAYSPGSSPAYAHSFNDIVKTNRIRFTSNNSGHFHIREFRIYEPNTDCYPTDLLSNSADTDVSGLNNLVRSNDVTITSSGVLRDEFPVERIADGNVGSSWVSQKKGEKWIEFNWPTEKEIGHIQFINGWQDGTKWNALITDYKIEAEVNGEWVELANFDAKIENNHAEAYHTYGMDWDASTIKFYFDNKLLREIPNTLCDKELNIYLSLAIFEVAGEVTGAIDGTSMKIDWVKYYQKK
ncbi:family 16 glycosylhydrolase [Flavivirga eckloniae]|uniref:Glycoside hydrolase n=1 Tax=Flavivirga eckloniae TaxID=1803846 RepID=A0A2K9PRL9_9FLAO|nr:family 16 glycosylhydrolase [Flavivirga eckloniae]AUP79712.1 glycoside hydrolase [Flavivirga eckloniae]